MQEIFEERIMGIEHPHWIDFLNRLEGAVDSEDCNRDLVLSFRVLRSMGFSYKAIALSLENFEEHGGYCDCEVLLNMTGRV